MQYHLIVMVLAEYSSSYFLFADVHVIFREKIYHFKELTFVKVIFTAVKVYTLKQESTLCWDGSSHTRLLVQPYTRC